MEQTQPIDWGHSGPPKEEAFLLELLDILTKKIVARVYNEGKEYELWRVESDSHALLLDMGRALRIHPLVEMAIDSALTLLHQQQKEQDVSSQDPVQCHRCSKEIKRSERCSGELTRYGDFPADYYALCPECEIDYLYECQGLTHICTLCGSRFAPSWRMKGFPEKILTELCGGCLAIPNIRVEVRKVQGHLERAQEMNLPATLTLKQWITTLAYFGWRCAYCSKAYEGIEHFVPLSAGEGGTTVTNCLPSCNRCNLRKSAKRPDEFAQLFPVENMRRIKEYLKV